MSVSHPVGVIGAGAFGVTMANVAASNRPVLLFTRHQELALEANQTRVVRGYKLAEGVQLISSPEQLCSECAVILPIIPSTAFRKTIRRFSPFLTPAHFVIHGTKGFDAPVKESIHNDQLQLRRDNVRTMSEVVREESNVLRIGCLSGPNLSSEIREGQPTATVIASNFREVVEAGQQILSTHNFQVFGSNDLLGAELAGALKNGLAIGSGILAGMGLGKNIQATMLTRGLAEMITLGKVMGADSTAFLGAAGIGDLIATATSSDSRNYSLGFKIGQGASLAEASQQSGELTEGVRTLRIVHGLIRHYRVHLPIFDTLYNVTVEGYPKERALRFLMNYPYNADVDFL